MIEKDMLKYVYYKNLSEVPVLDKKYAEESFDMLEKSLDYFEKELRNKKYIFTLANGKKIELEIYENNLAHVLGILTLKFYGTKDKVYSHEIIGFPHRRSTSSFDLLCRMIERRKEIIEYEYETGNKNVNFYRILVKTNIFNDINSLNSFDFAVSEMNPEIYSKMNKIPTKIKSKKLIIYPNEDAKYAMLGLKGLSRCILETVMLPVNDKDFLSKQKLSFPVKIEKTNQNGEKEICKEITNEEKIQLLEFYKELVLSSKREIKLDMLGHPKIMIAKM